MGTISGRPSHTLNMLVQRAHDGVGALPASEARRHARYPDPTACPRCEVVYFEGKWTWMLPPSGVFWVLCPACRRVEESYPAGFVTIQGPFLADHRAEILELVHDEEIAERDEHPLNRLMSLDGGAEAIEIATTDVHLPERIGGALHERFGGTLDVRYADDDSQVRVHWER